MPEKTKIVAQGAEAIIELKDNLIIKNRIPKSYRLKELDEKIRKQRTKAEKKLLEKACKIINAPNPFPLKEFDKIKMPFIEGKKLSEILDSFPLKKQKEICKKVGEEISKLHNADIIHGDLTTSNMILVEEKNSKKISSGVGESLHEYPFQNASVGSSRRGLVSDSEPIIFFIDFGLGYISPKVEDKAVDLHLLKQALEAKHFKNWEILFSEVLKGYRNSKNYEKVIERIAIIEKRGRYRGN
jgi:TP53 regulating kinase-like protein